MTPHVLIEWTASALTTRWGGYRVWRRPVRTPAGRWELIGQIDPPATATATQAEATLTAFEDHEAVGECEWTVTVIDAQTGFESAWVTGVTATAPDDRRRTWLRSNAAPWVACSTDRVDTPSLDTADRTVVRELAGRDHAVTRTPIELPTRTFSGRWHTFARAADSDFAALRAAAAVGETVAVLEPLGRRTVGTLAVKAAAEKEGGHGWAVDVEVVETTRTADPAGYNRACRLRFDGTDDYVTVPDAPELDPAGAAFTALIVATTPTGVSKALIAKGNPGVSDGWALGIDGTGKLVAALDGASGVAAPTSVSAPSAGQHVFAFTTNGSNDHKLWLDGATVATSTTATGSVTSAAALTVAASNGGATGFASCQARAWALWNRALDADELADAAAYFEDRSADLPAGAVLLHDVADDRCWDGTGTSLASLAGTQVSTAGTSLAGTITGGAHPVGDPWPLRLLDGEA